MNHLIPVIIALLAGYLFGFLQGQQNQPQLPKETTVEQTAYGQLFSDQLCVQSKFGDYEITVRSRDP